MRVPTVPFLILLLAIQAPVHADAPVHRAKDHSYRAVTVVEGFEYPWGVAFLPDGRFLVSEREGALRVVSASGAVGKPVRGMPEIWVRGQGGLLDVALDPDFADNRLIYFSYSEPGGDGGGTAAARARLDISGNQVTGVKVLFSQRPKSPGGRHFGSRLVFGPAGHLYITTGDRGERDKVQTFSINRGQIIRIQKDGRIPEDNPFVNKDGYRPEAWSLGHRNVQGAARHPETGKLWTVEHGARGGDEINIPEAGRNYGWPVISYGVHYWGGKIGVGAKRAGLEQPVYYWDPSIAPSGMAFYTGDKFPAWKGNLFIGALKARALVRLTLNGERVVGEERLLEDFGERIRDVRNGPGGTLYVLTDDDPGKLIKLEPVK